METIAERLESGEQTMLLLNRRGFSSFVACRACGERIQCVNCAVTLTYHRRDRRMLCHYCNYAQKVPSASVPSAAASTCISSGPGRKKWRRSCIAIFPRPASRAWIATRSSGKRHFESILHGFRDRDFDILVGTQMIAKGHDIPNVTLVGVVSADVGLGLPDFRAAERTFQLLTQAAGRAGRGNLPGIVLIQTINPEHYAVRFAVASRITTASMQKEIQFRKLMRYPPFSALANVLVRSQKQEDASRMSAELGRLLDPAPEGIKVLGPAEAPVPKLKSEFRYQLLLKAADPPETCLNETLRDVQRFGREQKWPATALVIDVDPLTLL